MRLPDRELYAVKNEDGTYTLKIHLDQDKNRDYRFTLSSRDAVKNEVYFQIHLAFADAVCDFVEGIREESLMVSVENGES